MGKKEELICNICQLIVKDPVSLPCYCIVCGEHLLDGSKLKKIIKCKTCDDEFNVPDVGFKTNKFAARILSNQTHLSKEEQKLKKDITAMNHQLAELLSTLNSEKSSIEVACSDRFSDIRRQIDIHRELVKQKVDTIALNMIYQTKVEEAKFLQKIRANIDRVIKVNIEKEEATFEKMFRQSNLLIDEVKELKNELDNNIQLLKSVIDELILTKDDIDLLEFKENQNMEHEAFGFLEIFPKTRYLCRAKSNTIKIIDLLTKQCIKKLVGHSDIVKCVYSLDENRLVSGSIDKTIKLWDMKKGVCLKTLTGHQNPVKFLVRVGNSNTQIASGSLGEIKIWDLNKGICIKTIKTTSYVMNCLIYLSDQKLASVSSENLLRVWDIVRGTCLREIECSVVYCLLLLKNGHLASGSYDKKIYIWDFNNGQCIKTLVGHHARINYLQQGECGQLISCSDDHSIKIWDLERGECIKTLTGHFENISCIQYSKDGLLVSISDYNIVKVWNLEFGTCTKTMTTTKLRFYNFLENFSLIQ